MKTDSRRPRLTPKRIADRALRRCRGGGCPPRADLRHPHRASSATSSPSFSRTSTCRGRVRATYPEILHRDDELRQDRFAPRLRPCRRPRRLFDDGDAAGALPRLSDRAAPPAHAQSRRAGRDRAVGRADPAPFRLSRRHACRGRGRRPDRAAAPRHVRRAGSRRHRRRHRQRHLSAGARQRRCRSPRSPPRASTIRSTACRTTPRPSPSIFQNFVIFTNYQFYVDEFVAQRAPADGARARAATRASSSPAIVVTPSGAQRAGLRHPARRACRRCRPII